jgi:hypothetical protein
MRITMTQHVPGYPRPGADITVDPGTAARLIGMGRAKLNDKAGHAFRAEVEKWGKPAKKKRKPRKKKAKKETPS